MPPKNAPNKKALEKQKAKVVEDKTFGLKNKNKSAKVQKYVATVKKTVDDSLKKKLPKTATGEPIVNKKTKAELEAEKKAELASLFKITQARVPPGADPKSILCEFFKQGMCQKGDKCKFSHDLLVARKGAKIDVYTDRRGDKPADGKEGAADDMESGNWTQETLEKVVQEREDKSGRRCASDIICKHFLDAVENRKYGWFWICPNGGDKCQYRHALPPGYVLKVDKKKEEEEKPEEPPIEEIIEEERKKLTTRTPMTKELFLKWKEDRQKKKKAAAEAEDQARREALKAGKTQMSGREMFEFHPEYFVDDDEAFGADDYIHKDADAEEMPETVLTVTGTSIVATQKNTGGKPLQPIHITDTSLFADDGDIPLPEDDDENDGKALDSNGHQQQQDGGSDAEDGNEEEDGEDDGEEEEDEKPEKPEKDK